VTPQTYIETFPGSSVVKFTFSLRRVSCKRMGMGFKVRCDGLHLKVHTGPEISGLYGR
jgi:hypothetical protein